MPDKTLISNIKKNDSDIVIKIKGSSVILSPGTFLFSVIAANGRNIFIKLPLYLKDKLKNSLRNYELNQLIIPSIYISDRALKIWYNRLPLVFKEVLGDFHKPNYEQIKSFFKDLNEVKQSSTEQKTKYGTNQLLLNYFSEKVDLTKQDPVSGLRSSLVKSVQELYLITGTRVDFLTTKMTSRKSAYSGFLIKKNIGDRTYYGLNKDWFESILFQYLNVIDELPPNSNQRKFDLDELKFKNEIKR